MRLQTGTSVQDRQKHSETQGLHIPHQVIEIAFAQIITKSV